MTEVTATNLSNLLQGGRIQDELLLQVYTRQLLDGLVELHSQNIAHKDIKPDNIRLLRDREVVDSHADAQTAQSLSIPSCASLVPPTTVSPDGTSINLVDESNTDGPHPLIGTPMYMSPEVITHNISSPTTTRDIWALGCVLIESVTGHKPWKDSKNEWEIMYNIGTTKTGPLLPEARELSERGIDFIKHCLVIDASVRPSAADLLGHPWMVDLRSKMTVHPVGRAS